jgi:hypothetical protein
MVAYLTPKRYKTMGLGIDLTDRSETELASQLSVASAVVNRYCAAPLDHDFRGGTVTDEKHRWNLGNVYRAGTTRLYPFHKPMRDVTGFRIDITNTQYITMQPEDLYLNEVENWVQPIALAVTTAGIFGFSILPGIGLREPVAKLSYRYGWRFATTDEELAVYSGSILMAANQFWVTDEEIVVKQNGTALTPQAEYSVDTTEGFVTVSSYDSSATYTASYTYPLPADIALATGLITNDVLGQAALAGAGMLGLSGMKVEEVELRQSSKVNFYVTPVNGAAATLLDSYVYRSIG